MKYVMEDLNNKEKLTKANEYLYKAVDLIDEVYSETRKGILNDAGTYILKSISHVKTARLIIK